MKTPEIRSIELTLRKPFFENYLRHIFSCPQGPIKINRSEDVGKYLYSRVRYSELPQRLKPGGTTLTLVLPHHENDRSDHFFIHYTEDDMVRINDFIEASAYLDFRTSIQVGSHDLKVDRKTVINLFSNLVFGDDKYEMLKKDEYRRRKKMEKWLVESIQEFGY
jgi:hypothetical protein